MNSESRTAETSQDDVHDFLQEICEATQGTEQSEIFEFAEILWQLLNVEAESGGDEELVTFVNTGADVLRNVVSSDETDCEQMESLRDEAIDRWGEYLSSEDADELGVADDWQGGCPSDDSADQHEEDSFESEDASLATPSADEISALLSQLGQSTPVSASPKKEEPASSNSAGASDTTPSNNKTESLAAPPANIDSCAASILALDPELREAFMDDASGCVTSMEDAMLRLDSDPKDSDALNQICRELHTLKGASASVGIADLANHLHGLEDSLRDDHTSGRTPDINSLLKNVDWIRSQLSSDSDGPSLDTAAPASNVTKSVSAKPSSASAPAATRMNPINDGPADDESVRVKSSQLNRLMDMLAELVMLRNRRETELTELQEVYHELIGSVSKMRLLSNDENRQVADCSSLQLSEVANDVLEIAQHVRDCARPVAEGNTAVSQFIRQFRQELVELRRTPVSGLFRRLQRVVRDAAQAESKEVRLLLVGEDAGIERSLQQRLYEPLLHIVRNSVCHGIESPEDRAGNGKESAGTITLEAKSGPDLFVIEVRDDGRGLDYDAIRRRGIEKGLLDAEQAASRQELSQLIFHPGFSTRETTSQVAGRGVGMDVVASTLQRMRGWLEVDSEPNQGTRIRLSFPLPSVIQHAMVFRSAGQLFALPMQSVQSAGSSDPNSVCVMFSDLLGGPRTEEPENCQRIVLACEAPSSGANEEGIRVTLLVDEVVGPEEVVVRPLPGMLKQHPFCSGATLSGMGQPVLCLDAHRVVESQVRHMQATPNSVIRLPRESSAEPLGRPKVLVVDDSLSARKRVVRSLQRYSVDVVEASDGKQALEILKKDRFAAVFSDMEMPHVSGMELLAEVNSQDRYEPPPVVIISSRGEDEFTKPAKELGAYHYLIKPLSDDALDQALTGIPLLRHLKANPSVELQTNGDLS
ncbi:MAG: hybrid sensor histidine kinase/response regulator [Rubripirellula sp.]